MKRRHATYRLSPVSWSISVTGIFCSKSSCGDSFDCWRHDRSNAAAAAADCVASRLRESFDRWVVALDLINDDVVVVCTSGTSRELLDDGLADPVDNSSFWASLFSFRFTPSSPSSGIDKVIRWCKELAIIMEWKKKKKNVLHMKYCTISHKINDNGYFKQFDWAERNSTREAKKKDCVWIHIFMHSIYWKTIFANIYI